jgi:hypothetical protein
MAAAKRPIAENSAACRSRETIWVLTVSGSRPSLGGPSLEGCLVGEAADGACNLADGDPGAGRAGALRALHLRRLASTART